MRLENYKNKERPQGPPKMAPTDLDHAGAFIFDVSGVPYLRLEFRKHLD